MSNVINQRASCPHCHLAVNGVKLQADGYPELGPFSLVTFSCPSCEKVLGMQLMPTEDAAKIKPPTS